jgi:hypothetical protein
MDDRQTTAAAFHEDVLEAMRGLSWDIGYQPPLLSDLMRRCGAVEAAKRALHGERPSEGFWVLARHGLLHRTIEAWVLHPQYAGLFSEQERGEARRRLEQNGFPVDAFLHTLSRAAIRPAPAS